MESITRAAINTRYSTKQEVTILGDGRADYNYREEDRWGGGRGRGSSVAAICMSFWTTTTTPAIGFLHCVCVSGTN